VRGLWGGIGIQWEQGLETNQAAEAAIQKQNNEKAVLLARALHDEDIAAILARSEGNQRSRQIPDALALRKGTDTSTMIIYIETLRNQLQKLTQRSKSLQFNTGFFTVNWAWVYVMLGNGQHITRYKRISIAFDVLAVMSRNAAAVSLVLLKLGAGAVAGFAILPALKRYLKAKRATAELRLVEAEYNPQIQH
jgi:hypothetical protein